MRDILAALINELVCTYRQVNGCGDCLSCAPIYEDAEVIAALEAGIEALKKKIPWIPVTEQLPEEGTEIIVNFATQAKKAMTGSAIYKHGTWWYMGLELTPDAVDAWMPLPEPYYPEPCQETENENR